MNRKSKPKAIEIPTITVSILSRRRQIKLNLGTADSETRLPSPGLETEIFLDKAIELSNKPDNGGISREDIQKLKDLRKRIDSGVYEGRISTAIVYAGQIYRPGELMKIRADQISPEEIRYVVKYVLDRANNST